MLPINDATIALIKRNEGCILHAYQDMVGVWTIGYGHLLDQSIEVEPLDRLARSAEFQLAPSPEGVKTPMAATRLSERGWI